ncbi:MAG TPA: hypothetical protein VK891_11305 [Euzebyales bacterium]|nr:hypothetical protein [Euzebyales bacterium]
MARVLDVGDVGRAVELMTAHQRVRLGKLLEELDTADQVITRATLALDEAETELVAAQAVRQRRLDAIESLVTAVAAGVSA